MSAVVVATAFGGPEVLSVLDEPTPEPGPGEVRVDVRAAGVNPVDYKLYSGARGADPGLLPMRLGFELAGVVTAVGPDATGPAGPVGVGDEVIGFRVPGAYAAEIVAPAAAFVPRPDGMEWSAAAGLMLAGATAVHMLAATGVTGGDTVLLHGGAGGVGLMVVQLAVARGARVVATASERHHARLRELGAVPVTYGSGLQERVRAAAPAGVTAALDAVGTDEAIDVSLALVPDRARIATVAAADRGLREGVKVLGGAPGGDPGTELRNEARLQLTDAVRAGTVRVFVAGEYPLAEAAAVHRELAAGHTSGKLALIP